MTTFYLDPVNGSDAADGLSFANRWKTFASGATAARTAPGDTIRIIKSPDPIAMSVTATWTNASPTITLSSAVNLTITDCESNWTASANVTCATNSDCKLGSNSQRTTIQAAFTTGKAAYFATGTLNLSAYRTVSFWFKNISGTIATGDLSLRLCTDTAGATSVHTIAIPGTGSLTNNWIPIAVDTGGAMNSAIQSVAIYQDQSVAAQTIQIDNIVACKGALASQDCLTLRSLISPANGTETWHAVQSINGTTIKTDVYQGAPSSSPNQGYYGSVTGSGQPIYHLLPLQPTTWPTSTSTQMNAVQESGTAGNLITYSGGWNSTDMSTQTGETWVDYPTGYAFNASNKDYIAFEKLYACRANYAFNWDTSATGCTITNCGGVANTYGLYLSSFNSTLVVNGFIATNCSNGAIISSIGLAQLDNVKLQGSSSYGAQLSGMSSCTGTTWLVRNGGNWGLYLSQFRNNKLTDFTVSYNTGDAIYYSDGCYNTWINLVLVGGGSGFGLNMSGMAQPFKNRFYNGSSSSNSFGFMYCPVGDNEFHNFTVNESTIVSSQTAFANSRVSFGKMDGTVDRHEIYTDGGTIFSETSERHTASGISWKLSPTSANRQANYPLSVKIATIAVQGGTLCTVKAYMKRDNAGLTGKLVCRGGQISGVASDVTTSVTNTGSWDEYTITFTPGEAGVVEIEAWAYGGTTYNLYVDDMTITQA